jgi:hypothetical protein
VVKWRVLLCESVHSIIFNQLKEAFYAKICVITSSTRDLLPLSSNFLRRNAYCITFSLTPGNKVVKYQVV